MLGGIEYVVPPLSFRQLQNLQPEIAKLSTIGNSIPSLDQLTTVATIVQSALSRNYPDVTIDTVLDALDLGNMNKIIPAIMGVSGLEAKRGESGEAVAVE